VAVDREDVEWTADHLTARRGDVSAVLTLHAEYDDAALRERLVTESAAHERMPHSEDDLGDRMARVEPHEDLVVGW